MIIKAEPDALAQPKARSALRTVSSTVLTL